MVYKRAGVAGHLQNRRAETVNCGSLSQAAAQLWSPNDRSYFRILEIYGPNILLSQNPVKCRYLSPKAGHLR